MHEIKSGSLKELWKVAKPIIISFFALMSMLFVDRLYLANYSPEALTASSVAGTLAWAFLLFFITLTNFGAVFVSQYNGSKQYTKIGRPVWQMIYVSIASILFYLLASTLGARLLTHFGILNAQSKIYFQYLLFFGPFFAFQSALGAFFIGRGQANVTKWVGILGNVVNIILDPIFIFGIKGIIPSYGLKGAAIATGIGILIQSLVLSLIFFQKKNQEKYHTHDKTFRPDLLKKCLKVAFPPSFFIMLEVLGWSAFFFMMNVVSPLHIFVSTIAQSIILLFIFFGLGLEKGAAAISGNMIGAKRFEEVKKTLFSGIKLITIFTLIVGSIFLLLGDSIVSLFINNKAILSDSSSIDISEEMLLQAKAILKPILFILLLYMAFENLRWLLNGILSSAGDTLFLMYSGGFCVWGFMVFPTYLIIYKGHGEVTTGFYIWIFYVVIAASLNLGRFFLGKWKKISLIENPTSSTSLINAEKTMESANS